MGKDSFGLYYPEGYFYPNLRYSIFTKFTDHKFYSSTKALKK
jgi:hypothetical protein